MRSRLLGLAREQLFAALLGASMFADAFVVAFRIPNLLRDLFAEGALSQAFVPTFRQQLKAASPHDAYELANKVAGTLVLVIGALVLAGTLFAPAIVGAMAGDYADIPGKFELTVTLTRVMLPFLMIVSLAAVAMGMLNAQDRFAAPALAPAMFNVTSICTGLGMWLAGVSGRWVAIGWALGTLLGGLAQLAIQAPSLIRTGYRPRLRSDVRLRDPRTRRVARLMAPAVIGLAAVQVNVFINTWFASSEPGAVAWLNYAFRFLQLPIGVFGVAIATVATTRYADAAAVVDHARMMRLLIDGLRLVLFLTVPATVGLFVMGKPIIQLIYERGQFGYHDALMTTAALELYIVGLVAYAAVKVIVPAFYAIDSPRIPVIASMTAVAANVTLSAVLHPRYGFRVLALGTAIAATLNFLVLFVAAQRCIWRDGVGELLRHALTIGAVAAVMGGGVHLSRDLIVGWIGTYGTPVRLVGTLFPVVIGVILYGIGCRLARVPELDHFARRFRRRASR
jgi:putative peptidoglycan lipid II flippase